MRMKTNMQSFASCLGPDNLDTDLGEVDNDVEPFVAFIVVPRYLAELYHNGTTTNVGNPVIVPTGSASDSTSLWRFLEQYYPSDDDEADSFLWCWVFHVAPQLLLLIYQTHQMQVMYPLSTLALLPQMTSQTLLSK
ncbi:hypothetical protein Salat_0235100 [Sesamum alatum]|uniref:Uncharacterized protein n=1 Tax=Sesamum alatum TaxID=300844 RepID=A0AAE1YYW1_9LAMI|nr:hypothetical protein Salat_0235100 [Sesamum alatum]